MKKAKCHHCDGVGELVTGRETYPHLPHLYSKNYWKCPKCGAFVGCHKYTKDPMGTMAKRNIRAMRHKVHLQFDPLWVNRSQRSKAYKDLAKLMRIPLRRCHIGLFGKEECFLALEKIKELRRLKDDRNNPQTKSNQQQKRERSNS